VPEEVAVLGVDNDLVIGSVSDPPLSSIDLDSRRIGYDAASLLDRLMSGERPASHELLIQPSRVVCRQSTDILAIDDREVAEAIRFIRERAAAGVRVEELVEATGLSRRVLEQRFQRSLHRTPKQEILRVQIDRAKALLADGETPVSKVAGQSGFTSLKYFARAFRRITGTTPRDYRKSARFSA
jgi:LacI family transcriptional regulator